MNVASLELCKELYELTGWGWGELESYYDKDPVFPTVVCPKYNLDYLLRKLPRHNHGYLTLTVTGAGEMWAAGYWDDSENRLIVKRLGDTPEDAAAKLAIGLIKQGILPVTKEGKTENE